MMSLNLACSGHFSHILPQIFAKLYGQKFSFLALETMIILMNQYSSYSVWEKTLSFPDSSSSMLTPVGKYTLIGYIVVASS